MEHTQTHIQYFFKTFALHFLYEKVFILKCVPNLSFASSNSSKTILFLYCVYNYDVFTWSILAIGLQILNVSEKIAAFFCYK